jgi:hypothetical protein
MLVGSDMLDSCSRFFKKAEMQRVVLFFQLFYLVVFCFYF